MRLLLTLSFLVKSWVVFGQFPAYYVYVIKGKDGCGIIRSGSNDIVRLSSQTFLFDNDKLFPGKDCELLLISSGKKRLSLRQTEPISVGDIAAKATAIPIPISQKYFRILFKNILKSSDANSDGINPEIISESWGAATRAMRECNYASYPINDEILGTDTISFFWNGAPTDDYQFAIYDNTNHPLLKRSANGNSLNIPSNVICKNDRDSDFYWSVVPTHQQCDEIEHRAFILLSPQKYLARSTSISNSLPKNVDEFIYYLELSDLLGQKGYIDAAIYYLRLAINSNRKSISN